MLVTLATMSRNFTLFRSSHILVLSYEIRATRFMCLRHNDIADVLLGPTRCRCPVYFLWYDGWLVVTGVLSFIVCANFIETGNDRF